MALPVRRELSTPAIIAIIFIFFACQHGSREGAAVASEGRLPITETAADEARAVATETPGLANDVQNDTFTRFYPEPPGELSVEQVLEELPQGFGYVHDAIPDVRYDIRYHGNDNFIGRPVDGYLRPVAILTAEALEALVRVADDLRQLGYGLIIYDAYRPQKAVDHFVRWARETDDTLAKSRYYPDVDKSLLFALGYIASRSSHSRGSAVDLGLYMLKTGAEVDMGSDFDLFGPISSHDSELVDDQQRANRQLLRNAMMKQGFVAYNLEWWHYRLREEPYPDTWFDFNVF